MSPIEREHLQGAREALDRAREHSERVSAELAVATVWLTLAAEASNKEEPKLSPEAASYLETLALGDEAPIEDEGGESE